MENNRISDIADVVLGIEAEMRKAGIWELEPPSPGALASTQPFCYDTLSFSQWLQWVLVPRMTTILEQGLELPAESHILPMAEEAWAGMPVQAESLLALLGRFDELITGYGLPGA